MYKQPTRGWTGPRLEHHRSTNTTPLARSIQRRSRAAYLRLRQRVSKAAAAGKMNLLCGQAWSCGMSALRHTASAASSCSDCGQVSEQSTAALVQVEDGAQDHCLPLQRPEDLARQGPAVHPRRWPAVPLPEQEVQVYVPQQVCELSSNGSSSVIAGCAGPVLQATGPVLRCLSPVKLGMHVKPLARCMCPAAAAVHQAAASSSTWHAVCIRSWDQPGRSWMLGRGQQQRQQQQQQWQQPTWRCPSVPPL
jgi:hypothetical protein